MKFHRIGVLVNPYLGRGGEYTRSVVKEFLCKFPRPSEKSGTVGDNSAEIICIDFIKFKDVLVTENFK
ncbi:MAG: hypothetical protein ACE5J9_07320 [Methanosarcinales archaeon]